MIDEGKLKKIFSDIMGIEDSHINNSTSMENVESWDSIKHMSFIIALEKEFNVDLDDDDIEQMINYEVIIAILNERQND